MDDKRTLSQLSQYDRRTIQLKEALVFQVATSFFECVKRKDGRFELKIAVSHGQKVKIRKDLIITDEEWDSMNNG